MNEITVEVENRERFTYKNLGLIVYVFLIEFEYLESETVVGILLLFDRYYETFRNIHDPLGLCTHIHTQ